MDEDGGRKTHLTARLDPDDRETVVAAALTVDETLSEFVRRAATRRADRVIRGDEEPAASRDRVTAASQ